METLKTNPNLMTVIINIQDMRSIININYNRYTDFNKLELLTGDELYTLQDELIPLYNKAIA